MKRVKHNVLLNDFRAGVGAEAVNLAEGNVGDLLADIMHYCLRTGIDFDNELRKGTEHFDAEGYEEDSVSVYLDSDMGRMARIGRDLKPIPQEEDGE